MKKLIKSYLKKLKYAGSTHQCPLCKYNAKEFLPGGLYKKRKNAKCPNCNSQERHRQLYLILQDYINKNDKKSLLHFAPEQCIKNVLDNNSSLEYKTSHYGETMDSDYHFDIREIDAKNDTFDFVICSHVLEHIDEDKKAMAEMCRVLKKEGVAFIQVPTWPSEKHPTYENAAIVDEEDRIIHFGQFDHVRIYGMDVRQRLEEAGFSNVEQIDLCQSLPKEIVEKYSLKNHGGVRDWTFVCTK
jgi:SAM-dependent methyltransferase